MKEYKGYKYDPTDDVEPGENCKTYHEVIAPDGKRLHMDWSPYCDPTQEDFELWIDLGMPDRFDQALGDRYCYGTLDREDLLKIQANGGAKPGEKALFSVKVTAVDPRH